MNRGLGYSDREVVGGRSWRIFIKPLKCLLRWGQGVMMSLSRDVTPSHL